MRAAIFSGVTENQPTSSMRMPSLYRLHNSKRRFQYRPASRFSVALSSSSASSSSSSSISAAKDADALVPSVSNASESALPPARPRTLPAAAAAIAAVASAAVDMRALPIRSDAPSRARRICADSTRPNAESATCRAPSSVSTSIPEIKSRVGSASRPAPRLGWLGARSLSAGAGGSCSCLTANSAAACSPRARVRALVAAWSADEARTAAVTASTVKLPLLSSSVAASSGAKVSAMARRRLTTSLSALAASTALSKSTVAIRKGSGAPSRPRLDGETKQCASWIGPYLPSAPQTAASAVPGERPAKKRRRSPAETAGCAS
mmetsp:Transcript_47152/g.110069  ORF Transcript_47152/g.110069 Transcript_47152/m.110069 type:complete len:321 (+) Transcript_47152:1530-2492(+)